VLEPASAVPQAEERGAAGGVVALRPPLGSEAVLAVVHRLFRAFAREDVEALQAILTDDASVLGFAHGGRGASANANGKGGLLDQWKMRLKNPAYARLAGVDLVDRDRIERFRYEDLGGGGGATAVPERPPGMRRDDLLVRFPVETPRLGSEQLFGDSMTLLLRRDGQAGMSYRIAGLGEDHAP
jgi:hypothetical protein